MAVARRGAEGTAIERLLVTLGQQAFTGRVDVREPDGDRSTVFLRAGNIVHIDRPDLLDRLDRVVVQANLVQPRAVAELRIDSETDEQIALALCRKEIAGVEKVKSACRLQLQRKLARILCVEGSLTNIVGCEHNHPAAGSQFAVAIDPRLFILACVRSAYDDERLSRALAPLAGQRVRLGEVTPAFLRAAGVTAQDGEALAMLASVGIVIEDRWLQARGDRKLTAAKALVLALSYIDALVVVEKLPTVWATNEPDPAVDSPAMPSVIDHVPSPPRRRRGITGLEVMDHATVGNTAENFFKNGDLSRAEHAFDLALKSDPKNHRWRAFSTWIRFWKPGTDREITRPEAVKTFREAINRDYAFAYGHYFLAEMYKLANDLNAAEREFRAAADADRGLVEAERELRLLVMRKGKGAPTGRRL